MGFTEAWQAGSERSQKYSCRTECRLLSNENSLHSLPNRSTYCAPLERLTSRRLWYASYTSDDIFCQDAEVNGSKETTFKKETAYGVNLARHTLSGSPQPPTAISTAHMDNQSIKRPAATSNNKPLETLEALLDSPRSVARFGRCIHHCLRRWSAAQKTRKAPP